MDKRNDLPVLQPEELIELPSQLTMISVHPGYHPSDFIRTHIGDTVNLRRPKITVDELGHNVWSTEIAAHDFELESPETSTDPYNRLKFEDY